MADWDDERDDESVTSGRRFPREPGRGGPELAGTFLDTTWRVVLDPVRPMIIIDGREIHLEPDGVGGYLTHEMFGRWRDVAELARAIVRFHPDYSPLARRRPGPVA
jgi:hypothetical protein